MFLLNQTLYAIQKSSEQFVVSSAALRWCKPLKNVHESRTWSKLSWSLEPFVQVSVSPFQGGLTRQRWPIEIPITPNFSLTSIRNHLGMRYPLLQHQQEPVRLSDPKQHKNWANFLPCGCAEPDPPRMQNAPLQWVSGRPHTDSWKSFRPLQRFLPSSLVAFKIL